ncbi:unnamed protein product [Chrysoparadoxa australica]
MTTIDPDTLAEALAAWLLDAPPIAHPCPDPVQMAVVRIRDKGAWPTALIDGTPHHIVGVTASGWLSIAGAGWRQFRGSAANFERVAAACNAAQIVALSDRILFDGALHCHGERPGTGSVGGLEWIETEDGHRWISFDDIIHLDVRAAFHHRLAAEGGKDMLRIRYNLGYRPVSKTFAKADAWRLFARNWTSPLSEF